MDRRPLSLPPDTAHKVSVCQSVGAIHQSNNRSSRNPITDQLSYVIIILIRVFCPSLSTHDSRKKRGPWPRAPHIFYTHIHTYVHDLPHFCSSACSICICACAYNAERNAILPALHVDRQTQPPKEPKKSPPNTQSLSAHGVNPFLNLSMPAPSKQRKVAIVGSRSVGQ